MQILSWNINGLKACLKSDSFNFIYDLLPDIICLQEIRTHEEPVIIDGCHHYWNHSKRDGFYGMAVLTMDEPISVTNRLNNLFQDDEDCIITVEPYVLQ